MSSALLFCFSFLPLPLVAGIILVLPTHWVPAQTLQTTPLSPEISFLMAVDSTHHAHPQHERSWSLLGEDDHHPSIDPDATNPHRAWTPTPILMSAPSLAITAFMGTALLPALLPWMASTSIPKLKSGLLTASLSAGSLTLIGSWVAHTLTVRSIKDHLLLSHKDSVNTSDPTRPVNTAPEAFDEAAPPPKPVPAPPTLREGPQSPSQTDSHMVTLYDMKMQARRPLELAISFALEGLEHPREGLVQLFAHASTLTAVSPLNILQQIQTTGPQNLITIDASHATSPVFDALTSITLEPLSSTSSSSPSLDQRQQWHQFYQALLDIFVANITPEYRLNTSVPDLSITMLTADSIGHDPHPDPDRSSANTLSSPPTLYHSPYLHTLLTVHSHLLVLAQTLHLPPAKRRNDVHAGRLHLEALTEMENYFAPLFFEDRELARFEHHRKGLLTLGYLVPNILSHLKTLYRLEDRFVPERDQTQDAFLPAADSYNAEERSWGALMRLEELLLRNSNLLTLLTQNTTKERLANGHALLSELLLEQTRSVESDHLAHSNHIIYLLDALQLTDKYLLLMEEIASQLLDNYNIRSNDIRVYQMAMDYLKRHHRTPFHANPSPLH